MIGWEGGDKDFAVPLVEEARKNYSQPRCAIFDRGCHGPDSQEALDRKLDCNAPPKKGKQAEAKRERPGVRDDGPLALPDRIELNNLEQRGLDRVLSQCHDGFARMVNLSVLSLNVASSA